MPVRHTRDHHREAEKVAYGDVGIKLRVSKEIYRHTVVTASPSVASTFELLLGVRRYGGEIDILDVGFFLAKVLCASFFP